MTSKERVLAALNPDRTPFRHGPHYRGPSRPAQQGDPNARRTIELDPESLEQSRREQLDLAFDA
ncbi:MAG: hypothetical protein HQ546_03700 [Planctomycetes bacterium]|nr:hypothetical protein [Planctomycetota bacterium]